MSERNLGFFANIPSEIIIEIISKLPVGSIISCKCVCKSWLTLVESGEFVKSHLLKSLPGLAVYRLTTNLYGLFEFDGGLDLEHDGLHYKPVTKFNIPTCDGGWICGSTNGLLFLCIRMFHGKDLREHLHICNPITRDYIQLGLGVAKYGFVSSKITGQHKVVRIFKDHVRPPVVSQSECVCHVYTVETGLWKRIASVAANLLYDRYGTGAFLNGNLHWSVSDAENPRKLISCFDLETERFSIFSTPLLKSAYFIGPTVLGDFLRLCDNNGLVDGISLWLMKDYGVEKSWTKQFFICDPWPPEVDVFGDDVIIYPIKIFKDGDILLTSVKDYLFYLKKDNSSVQKLEIFGSHDVNGFLYVPSFLSLKSFGIEGVVSFLFCASLNVVLWVNSFFLYFSLLGSVC